MARGGHGAGRCRWGEKFSKQRFHWILTHFSHETPVLGAVYGVPSHADGVLRIRPVPVPAEARAAADAEIEALAADPESMAVRARTRSASRNEN